MCNRYRPARAEALPHRRDWILPPVNWHIGDPVGLRDIGPRQLGVFVRPAKAGGLEEVLGVWGLIGDAWRSPVPPVIGKRPQMTNNARAETMAELRTYAGPWARGQRCLIPAAWWIEPCWETGRNAWWRLQLAGGAAAALAGLYNTWVDRETGEVHESYTMVTLNCDGHPLLARMHRPDPQRPEHMQDKRAVVPLAPEAAEVWLHGSADQARDVLQLPVLEDLDGAPEAATLPGLF